MTTLSELAVELALAEVGVKEIGGNNRGARVETYLSSVGLAAGQPWCSAFLAYIFETAAARLKLRNPYPMTGSSQAVWRRAEPVCRDSMPSLGAVYVLSHSATSGHVGIVTALDADGVITEVSGNTFDGKGGRAGDSVAVHVGQPEVVHGPATLLGYLNLDRAAQQP